MLKRIQYSQSVDTSSVRERPNVPEDCISLYKSSFEFDITSSNPDDRCEFWTSNQGTITESEADLVIYKGKSELEFVGHKLLTNPETVGFLTTECDILEVSINNLSEEIKLVTVEAVDSGSVLETVTLGIGEITTLTIPKPFDRYKVTCPGNVFVKLNRYVLT